MLAFTNRVACYFALAATVISIAATAWGSMSPDAHIAVGPSAGETFEMTTKYWEHPSRALQAGAGYSVGQYIILHADYLFQFPEAVAQLTPYVGVGAEYSYSTADSKGDKSVFSSLSDRNLWGGMAARVSFGAEWLVAKKSFGAFAEVVPGYGFLPELFWILRGGAGVRFYF